MKTHLQFGAGNAGRAVMGALFAGGGYEIVFTDVDSALVDALNARGEYPVALKHADGRDEVLTVTNVRAIHAGDREAVATEIASADSAATSVGSRALPHVAPPLAAGLIRRVEKTPDRPLDVIVAENIRGGEGTMRKLLLEAGMHEDVCCERIGVVSSVIGTVVPTVPGDQRADDPLLIWREPVNEVIVDAHAFRGLQPQLEGLHPVDEIEAYVDRKLLIHNMGHAATAYLAHVHDPSVGLIDEAIRVADVRDIVDACMHESSAALAREYPEVFNETELDSYIHSLLDRMANHALGDTITRVGRDLRRKLSRDDRLIGALLLALKHGGSCPAIASAIRAAFCFDRDDAEALADDQELTGRAASQPAADLVVEICGLSMADPTDASAIAAITG